MLTNDDTQSVTEKAEDSSHDWLPPSKENYGEIVQGDVYFSQWHPSTFPGRNPMGYRSPARLTHTSPCPSLWGGVRYLQEDFWGQWPGTKSGSWGAAEQSAQVGADGTPNRSSGKGARAG